MPQLRISPRSLRDRFLLVVLFAAVLPLAVIGFWLTAAAGRAAEDLRRAQLHEALDQLEHTVRARWLLRQADLLWLAENEIVRQALLGGVSAGEPPAQLADLFDAAAHGIVGVRYRGEAGRSLWELVRTGPFDRPIDSMQRGRIRSPTLPSTFTVRLPVTDFETGRRIGDMEADVRLTSVLPVDTLSGSLHGLSLAVMDSSGAPLLLPDSLPGDRLHLGGSVVSDERWIAESRALQAPPIQLAVAAPLAPFEAPFRRAARTGVLALFLVCVTALALTTLLTTRLTRSLRDLAAAADAVAAGDLHRNVSVRGADEVGRVGAAFNSMTDSLRRTLELLAQRRALAAVGEFAASLSHEVRNAHTSIRVDLQRAQRKIPQDVPARELVDRALQHVERLDRSVTGLLRVARSGRVDAALLDLREPLRLAIDIARAEADRQAITLVPRMSAEPIRVRGEADALQHLFLNLLLNAVDASTAGDVVDVETRHVGSGVEVTIRDRGSGLAAGDAERVFEPFYSTKPTGTGLGLSIARRIAEAHGGSVVLLAEDGPGLTARVILPVA